MLNNTIREPLIPDFEIPEFNVREKMRKGLEGDQVSREVNPSRRANLVSSAML